MKYSFLVSISLKNKTGLFNAIHSRIKQFQINGENFEVWNLSFVDSPYLTLLKKIFGIKSSQNEIQDSFIYDGVQYRSINLERGILCFVLDKLNFQYLSYFLHAKRCRELMSDVDLISAHWGLSCGLLGYWLKKMTKIPVVVTYHGSDIHTIPFKNYGWKFSLRKVFKCVNGNIFISKSLYDQAIELATISNFCVIHNGVDKSQFKPASLKFKQNRKKAENLEGKVVGFVGNLVNIKNVMILPDVFSRIKANLDDDCSFIILGDGPLHTKLKDRFNKIGINVAMIGEVSPKKVASYMSIMDLIVLPSLQEGFGMVLWEAKSSGSKCVGSRVGGIPEAIGIENTVPLGSEFVEEISKLGVKLLKNSIGFQNSAIQLLDWSDVHNLELKYYNTILCQGLKYSHL